MFFDQFNKLCSNINMSPTQFVTNVLHLSSSKVTAWKNGSIPKYGILNEIASYFNVSVGYLFDGESGSFLNNLSKNEQALTDIEEKLLKDFRNLSQQGQDYIRQQMFMAREVYKKDSLSEADLNVG